MGCYSTQTYKHINSGEGGFIISDDPELMAKAVLMSGSYMLYDRHDAAPDPSYFEDIRYEIPNISGRMDNLRAAILRPQLRDLVKQATRWNDRYKVLDQGLGQASGLTLIPRDARESFVASSFQFLLLDWSDDAIRDVVARCLRRGVELKWFGAPDPSAFTSRYSHWRYAASDPMPDTDRILSGIMDLRLPLTFSLEDCAQISRIIRAEVSVVWQRQMPTK
jgi:dTDP-4-amino-4,6-dideoxygalactose transaminase